MRLNHRTIRPTGAAIRIRFDGQDIPALTGETVAAALSAAGIVAFRRTARRGAARAALRHGRLLRLRGDDRRADRPARLPDQGRRRDAGERRACRRRPGAAGRSRRRTRRPAERDLRRAGGRRRAGRAVGGDRRGRGRCRGGAARRAGGDRRAIRQAAGRQPRRHGAGRAVPPRPAICARAPRQAGVAIETDATVWAGFAPDEIAALVRGRAVTFRPRRLVLAPGAHEAAGADPGLDTARRDDHRRAADAGAGAARCRRAARA